MLCRGRRLGWNDAKDLLARAKVLVAGRAAMPQGSRTDEKLGCPSCRETREADICGSASFSLPSQSFRSRPRTFGWRIAIGAWPKLATHEPALASPNHAPPAPI